MKKLILYSLAGLFAVSAVFTSCKKGEDDPAISLKTRKSRLTGEWKLVSGTETDINRSESYNTTTTITYDGSTANESSVTTSDFGDFSSTETYPYTYEIIFEKDGTFKLTEIEDGYTFTGEGTWAFTGGLDDKKNKSQIVMNYSKTVEDGETTTYEGEMLSMVFYLKELRKDKVVMIGTYNSTYADGSSNEANQELVLEPK